MKALARRDRRRGAAYARAARAFAIRAIVGAAVPFTASPFAGCSADAVTPPEPTLETPGSFLLIKESSAAPLQLYRVLSTLKLNDGRRVIFVLLYSVEPRGVEDARSLALRRDLPTDGVIHFYLQTDFSSMEWSVVWFRTLTDAEYRYL